MPYVSICRRLRKIPFKLLYRSFSADFPDTAEFAESPLCWGEQCYGSFSELASLFSSLEKEEQLNCLVRHFSQRSSPINITCLCVFLRLLCTTCCLKAEGLYLNSGIIQMHHLWIVGNRLFLVCDAWQWNCQPKIQRFRDFNTRRDCYDHLVWPLPV